MALKSTIYKFNTQVNNFDTDHYQHYSLSIALHPSEKVERMLLRWVAFCLFANERLSFTKGLSTDDEPDLWQKSLSDEIELWIELGLPDEKRLKKGLNRSQQCVVFAYGGQKVESWFEQVQRSKLDLARLQVYQVDTNLFTDIASELDRNVIADCTIQDGSCTLCLNDANAYLTPLKLA